MRGFGVLLLAICVCWVGADIVNPGFGYTPGICLDEEEAKLRFVNESCTSNEECYNYMFNSTECLNGFCACANDYIAEEQQLSTGEARLVCTPAPIGNMSCTSKCQQPYVCVDVPAESNPDGSTFGAAEKQCRCQSPYVEKDGGCVLECGPGEIFYGTRCVKRCSAGEIAADDGTCKKTATLNEACETRFQCVTPFADCQSGRCVCGGGFTPNANNDACDTSSWTCPGSETVRVDGAPVECTILKASGSGPSKRSISTYAVGGLSDTCADDQYCLITGNSGYFVGAKGYCCQTPKLSCPIGSPHPSATCQGSAPLQGPTASGPEFCPLETHSCRQMSFGEGFSVSLCCPDQCNYKQVLAKGKCYPKRDYEDQCDVDEQCAQHGGVCQNGVCTCPTNANMESIGAYKYCVVTCKDDERRVSDRECEPALKLGAQCDPFSLDQPCPTNSHCSPKSKTCICDCGQIRLNDRTCGPQPRCSLPGSNISDASIGRIDPSAAVFCSIGDEAANALNAVKECPTGQYCQSYLPFAGLCCPKPEQPICPDGTVGKEKCDPMGTVSCGDTDYCHKYLDTAGPDDNTAFVCCPFGSASAPF